MKKNLQAGIDRLKALPMMRKVPWGRCYDALVQMDWVTGGNDGTKTLEEFLIEYEKEHGSREAFVMAKTEQWNRQYNKKKEV